MCFVVFHSSQDHVGTGTHDLDYPISYQCKKMSLKRQFLCGIKEFYDLGSVNQLSTFSHLELRFQELVNLKSLFRVTWNVLLSNHTLKCGLGVILENCLGDALITGQRGM
jgi:hypothetical protein